MSTTLDEQTAGDPRAELARQRNEVIARLRAARADLSPRAAVTAAASTGDLDEAAALGASSLQAHVDAPPAAGFRPRSMTMKLLLERPEVTLSVVLALVGLLFGARHAQRLGSAAAAARTLLATLDTLRGPPSA